MKIFMIFQPSVKTTQIKRQIISIAKIMAIESYIIKLLYLYHFLYSHKVIKFFSKILSKYIIDDH